MQLTMIERFFICVLLLVLCCPVLSLGLAIDPTPTVNILTLALRPKHFPPGTDFVSRQAELHSLLLHYKHSLEVASGSGEGLNVHPPTVRLGLGSLQHMRQVSQDWKTSIFIPWAQRSHLDQKQFGKDILQMIKSHRFVDDNTASEELTNQINPHRNLNLHKRTDEDVEMVHLETGTAGGSSSRQGNSVAGPFHPAVDYHFTKTNINIDDLYRIILNPYNGDPNSDIPISLAVVPDIDIIIRTRKSQVYKEHRSERIKELVKKRMEDARAVIEENLEFYYLTVGPEDAVRHILKAWEMQIKSQKSRYEEDLEKHTKAMKDFEETAHAIEPGDLEAMLASFEARDEELEVEKLSIEESQRLLKEALDPEGARRAARRAARWAEREARQAERLAEREARQAEINARRAASIAAREAQRAARRELLASGQGTLIQKWTQMLDDFATRNARLFISIVAGEIGVIPRARLAP